MSSSSKSKVWIALALSAFITSGCSARWNRPRTDAKAQIPTDQNPPGQSFWVSETGADVDRTGGNFRVNRASAGGSPKQKQATSAHFVVTSF